MKKISLYNDKGEKIEEISLNEKIFSIKSKKENILVSLKRQLSHMRKNIAYVKSKSEVSGGGRKPYKQKGTGRARQGSTRNPQFRGGGKAFGPPNNRNFTLGLPKKIRRLALFSALSQKLDEDQIFALDNYKKNEIKTKQFVDLLHKLPVKKSLLLVTDKKNEILEKSSRNVPNLKIIRAEYMNIYDILKHEKICFLKAALPILESTFLKSSI